MISDLPSTKILSEKSLDTLAELNETLNDSRRTFPVPDELPNPQNGHWGVDEDGKSATTLASKQQEKSPHFLAKTQSQRCQVG